MCNSALGLQMHLRLNYLLVYDGGQDFQGLKHFLETQGIKEAVMGLMSLIGKV